MMGRVGFLWWWLTSSSPEFPAICRWAWEFWTQSKPPRYSRVFWCPEVSPTDTLVRVGRGLLSRGCRRGNAPQEGTSRRWTVPCSEEAKCIRNLQFGLKISYSMHIYKKWIGLNKICKASQNLRLYPEQFKCEIKNQSGNCIAID